MTDKEAEKVLTPEEADALLEGVREGAVATEGDSSRGIREIEITQWDRIVRGRVPALEAVNERLAAAMQLSFFKLLRREVVVTGEPVQMLKWIEYAESLPVPTSLAIVRCQEQEADFLVAISPDLVFELVDAYFGGRGGGKRKNESAEFTPTETRVVRSTVQRMLEDVKEAWSVFLPLSFSDQRVETNPQFAAIGAHADAVYVSRFQMELNGHGGEFHVVLPSAMVDPVRHLVNVGSPRDSDNNKDYWQAALKDDVRGADVTLRTVLASSRICLGDLLSMQPGDIIPIEIPETATVFAGDSPVFEGRFGVSNGRNAIKVTQATGESLALGRN